MRERSQRRLPGFWIKPLLNDSIITDGGDQRERAWRKNLEFAFGRDKFDMPVIYLRIYSKQAVVILELRGKE